MYRSTRKLFIGTVIFAAATLFALSNAQAEVLKLRLSVESTPGALSITAVPEQSCTVLGDFQGCNDAG